MFFFSSNHKNSSHKIHVVAGAFYDFLVGICLPEKTHYVWGMLVIYFKNDSPSFKGQGFSLQVISGKLWEGLKTQIFHIFV